MKILTVLLSILLPGAGLADAHSPVTPGEGAFTTLVVQANDIDAYLKVVKANPGIPEANGALAAGYCVTRSGNDYPGQMFIWSAYNNVSEAMAAATKYDPYAASEEFSSLRQVKYTAIFKPMNQFKLDPGFERLWRVVVPADNLNAFVQGVVKIEASLRKRGYDINMGVFYPLAGGVAETKTLHLRAVTRDGATAGKITDEYFAGEAWATTWSQNMALTSSIESETIEVCSQYYSAE